MTEYERLAASMISEIRSDMIHHIVPYTVGSFNRLHDYVDANEYCNADHALFNLAVPIVNDWLAYMKEVHLGQFSI